MYAGPQRTKIIKILTLLTAVTISVAGCSQSDRPATESSKAAASDAADTVYTDGKIYTVNTAQPWVEAVAIKERGSSIGSLSSLFIIN